MRYALVGLAVLGLFGVLLRTWWSWLLGLAFTVSFIVPAAQTYASGTAGHPVEMRGTTGAAIAVGIVFTLALLAVAAVVSRRLAGAARWARLAGIVLLVLASLLVLLFLGPMFLLYASHDTTPWLQALGGVFTVLAASTLLGRERARRPQAAPTAPALGPARSVAT